MVRRPGHGAADFVLHVPALVSGLPRQAAQREFITITQTPWSMLGPLVILALLSICGGWIGIERFSAFLAPAIGARAGGGCTGILNFILSLVAVAVALVGWFVADRLYRRSPSAAGATGRGVSRAATSCWPTNITSTSSMAHRSSSRCSASPSSFWSGWWMWPFWAGWPGCWAASPLLSGAILQRWQSGNHALLCGVAGRGRGGGAAVRAGSVGHGAGQSFNHSLSASGGALE